MRELSAAGGVDVRIAEVAGRRHGLVTTRQLLALGLGRNGIALRVAAGRLHRVHRGVFHVGHATLTREARWLAAVLACGDGALLSHASAAALWGIADHDPVLIDVTATGGGRKVAGIRAHRHRLGDVDRAEHLGIPVTAPGRTLADISYGRPFREVRTRVRRAEYLDLFDIRATREANARRPSRALGQVLRVYELNARSRSELEREFEDLCRRHHLPQPVNNVLVHGFLVDFLWAPQRVVVETDGWRGHRGRGAFQDDRTRGVELSARGFVVLRFTFADVLDRPGWTARRLRTVLAARGA